MKKDLRTVILSLEHAITVRPEIFDFPGYLRSLKADLEAIDKRRDLEDELVSLKSQLSFMNAMLDNVTTVYKPMYEKYMKKLSDYGIQNSVQQNGSVAGSGGKGQQDLFNSAQRGALREGDQEQVLQEPAGFRSEDPGLQRRGGYTRLRPEGSDGEGNAIEGNASAGSGSASGAEEARPGELHRHGAENA